VDPGAEALVEPAAEVLAERGVEAPGEPAAEAGAQPPETEGFGALGQETAELDMAAHMAQEGEPEAAAAVPHGAEPSDDELLEWEEPSAPPGEPPPEQIPGQERLSLE
jgi:hypothetical protein